jgi:hypothetical protein
MLDIAISRLSPTSPRCVKARMTAFAQVHPIPDPHGARISYQMVKRHVARHRNEIRVEAARAWLVHSFNTLTCPEQRPRSIR